MRSQVLFIFKPISNLAFAFKQKGMIGVLLGFKGYDYRPSGGINCQINWPSDFKIR